MALGGLWALLDDLATLLDDVAVMSKVAAGKAAGVAGDDLAVGAQQVIGLDPSRELPIVWAVAKGSFINKAYLVPGALALSAVAPFLIMPIMMAGGAFLCYEGMEKILHKLKPGDEKAAHEKLLSAAIKSAEDLKNFEKEKIAEAIRTDTVLSAEIVVIALGAMATAPFMTKVIALSAVAIGLTALIYGLIALIVKADDLGLHLARKKGLWKKLGGAILKIMPKFMKGLSIVGTAAMFMVGGGILVHGVPLLEAWFEGSMSFVFATFFGMLAGLLLVPIVTKLKEIKRK